MKFELLPNEIVLDMFSYIDSTNLLAAFYGLNTRLNYLLYHQSHGYRFKFENCSKNKFDMICQQHLPTIANQVLYLNLSDFNHTPGQIKLFFSYIPSISSFTNLRSLKICHVYPHLIGMKIINELHFLSNLTHLIFNPCYDQYNRADIQLIINKIWSLPKLNYVHYNVHCKNDRNFSLPAIISTSIKTLHLSSHTFTYNQSKELFQYTPYLKRLHIIYLDLNTYEHSQSCQFLTLTHLHVYISCLSDTSKIILFLQNLPNLCQLYVNVWSNIIDGYQWEQLIENYLLKLRTLTFIMEEQCPPDQNVEERAEQLLNSFQISFWIDKHKWFVRCLIYKEDIYLQTLPSTCCHFETRFPCSWKSTDPNDDLEKYFNTITSIYNSMRWDQPRSSALHLTNIEYLSITLPIHDQFWSIVSSLQKLKTLTIFSYNDSVQSQLQMLLDHASNLSHLTIRQAESLPLQTSLFQLTNTSIRNLNLADDNQEFNKELCLTLCHSSLGKQCEILFIQVKSCQSILTLIDNMTNLNALHVQYGNRMPNQEFLVSQHHIESCEEDAINIDETIQWLKDHLPSTYFISKEFTSINSFHIWLK